MRGDLHSRKRQALSHAKPASQQQCQGDVLAPARPGAMALQSGLAMQAGQSYPQQLVQLVGHRDRGAAKWVRPRADI